MNNNNTRCKHYCSWSTNHCYYCHPQELSSSYCCYSCSISIEEILTWIIICLFTILLYNTIKLCIIIFLILFIIYWICKQIEISRLIKKFYQKNNDSNSSIIKFIQTFGKQFNSWINLKSSINNKQEQQIEYISSIDSNVKENNVEHSSNKSSSSSSILNSNIIENNINNENDNDEYNLSTKISLNSNFDINTISNSISLNNSIKTSQDHIIPSKIILNKEKNSSHQSTIKKLLIKNTQHQKEYSSDSNLSKQNSNINLKFPHYENSITQPGYHGPIHTIINIDNQNKNLPINIITKQIEENLFENRSIIDIIEQTKGIRQAIETLHKDILQLKINSNKNTIDDISNLTIEEKTILKLATEYLIQTIMSIKIDKKSNIINEQNSVEELAEILKHNNNKQQQTSHLNLIIDTQQSEEMNNEQTNRENMLDINASTIQYIKSKDNIKSKVNSTQSSKSKFDLSERHNLINTKLDDSIQFQHPKCITVQTSFVLPRVPTKAIVIALNDDEDKSSENYENTMQYIIVNDEQFENIPTKKERNSENDLFLKQDSIIYNNEQIDWPNYLSKPDLFSNTIQTDLPIAQSDDQHLSFKQTFLSHFHHRHPKFTSINNPATLHSSSLNATNTKQKKIDLSSSSSSSINSNENIKWISNFKQYQYNTIIEQQQQQIAQKLLNNKESFNYIWNKTLNHLKQRIFRVRKSRIIISFDDIQQQKNANHNDKNNFDTLINTVVQDMSKEINHARSQLTNQSFINPLNNNKQQTKIIINDSMVSLFQSFDSVIREGELSLYKDKQYKSFCQVDSENEDSLSIISNSLYSVTSQLILT